MPNAPTVTSDSFAFYTRVEYFRDLAWRIEQTAPGRRVLLTTMSLDATEPLIARVIDTLVSAAQRGVSVHFAFDAYTFTIGENPMEPLFWHKELPAHLHGISAHNRDALDRMRAAGVVCALTNHPHQALTNPFKGRSHIKVAVINDYVYMGGCNLHQTEWLDCMVGWHDAISADWLYETVRPLAETGYTAQAFGLKDKSFSASENMRWLLDVGVKKQSIILENALDLIDKAQEWVILSCQFLPNGLTANHLLAAHKRGVKVFLLLNDLSQQSGVHVIIQNIVTFLEKRRLPASFFETTLAPDLPFLHAKILASEHESIVGSHNFMTAGVNFGTAELAMRRSDPVFAKRIVTTLLKQTNFAEDPRLSFLKNS